MRSAGHCVHRRRVPSYVLRAGGCRPQMHALVAEPEGTHPGIGSPAIPRVNIMRESFSCPRCNTTLERGYLADIGQGDATQVANWIGGAPDKHWYGLKTKGHDKMPLSAYRCDRCGYVELHALHPSDAEP